MNRINVHDNKYKKLYNIPKPIKIMKDKILLRLLNYNYSAPSGYLIKYTFHNSYNIIEVKFVIRITMYQDKYYDVKTSNKYIFNVNSKYSKLVDYTL